MSAGDDSRLGRWSRLKRKRARGEAVEEPAPRGAAAPTVAPAPGAPAGPADGAALAPDEPERQLTEEEAAYVETLPPIEELTPDSDFSGFMDRRVPEFLRRQALRRLWLSDPAFGFIDGMHEYGEDYSMLAQLAAGATAYRPDEGGYAWRDKPKEKDGDTAEGAAPNAAHAAAEDAAADDAARAGRGEETGDESMAAKAKRVQDRGGSDVTMPTYTPNPYYQAPGVRNPAPDSLPTPTPGRLTRAAAGDGEDDLGDGEDDFG